MGYDPSKKAWVMAYRRLMGYPPYPNSGRAKKYGVPGIMGYQDLWVKGTSTVRVNLYSYLPGAVATYFLGLLHRCALRNLNAAGLGAVLQIPPL